MNNETTINLTLDSRDVSRILALLDFLLAPTLRESAIQELAELLRESIMER